MLRIFATLLAGLLLCAQTPMLPGFPLGTFQNRAALDAAGGGGGGCPGTLVLDGGGSSTSTAGSQVASLTTTGTCGQICGATYGGSGSGAITSITGSGLTFTFIVTSTSATGNTTEAWCAPYSSNFSGNITANWANSSALTNLTVFGIAKAVASSPVDSTGTSTTTEPVITTTNANDFIFSIQGDGFTPTPGTGWTLVDPGGPSFFNVTEYKIVSTTQAGLVALNGGTSSGGIVVAIKN